MPKKHTPKTQRWAHHKYRYGLERHEYEEMLIRQDNRCYTCDKLGGDTKGTRLHIDHNHRTGEVRKLLCNRCNYIAGCIEDYRYVSVLKYLEEHDGRHQ